MAKKKDKDKCEQCGYRLILAYFNEADFEVTPDQEPYEADKIEPVIVKGKEIETVLLNLAGSCHVCPNCNWIRDFDGISELI